MNLRPPRPERGALPDCATLRLKAGFISAAPHHRKHRSDSDRRARDPHGQDRSDVDCGCRARAGRGRAGRLPDRNRLRAGRGCRGRRGGGAALRRQGAADLQSADLPCARRGRGQPARALPGGRRTPGGSLLAGTAHAGAAEDARWPGRRARHGRARHHCVAGAQPPGGAGHPGAIRPGGGSALGQPLRSPFADHRRRTCLPTSTARST